MMTTRGPHLVDVPEGSPIPAITELTLTFSWNKPQRMMFTIYLDPETSAM